MKNLFKILLLSFLVFSCDKDDGRKISYYKNGNIKQEEIRFWNGKEYFGISTTNYYQNGNKSSYSYYSDQGSTNIYYYNNGNIREEVKINIMGDEEWWSTKTYHQNGDLKEDTFKVIKKNN